MRSALRRGSDVKSCLRRVVFVLAIGAWSVSGTCLGAPPPAPQPVTPDKETTAEGIGLQAASVFTSILYLPFKSMLAVAGGLAGGIAYAFSLGDMEVAEAVWGPSVYGTYLIVPEHFTGEKPVEFFGTVPTAKR